jgi:hypothetical protein
VVTSRNQLSSLVAVDGAHPLMLDLLTQAEARELLARRLGPDRIGAEPQAVEQIIACCVRLPLALTIAAARAEQSGFPLTALAGELEKASGRLDALDAGDPVSQVRTVFSWSYTTLPPAAARLFRLLGLHPGPDISVAAAASLAAVPPTGDAAAAGRTVTGKPAHRTHPRPVHLPRPAARLRHRPHPLLRCANGSPGTGAANTAHSWRNCLRLAGARVRGVRARTGPSRRP